MQQARFDKPRWKSVVELLFSGVCIILLAIFASENFDTQDWVWFAFDLVALFGFTFMFAEAWENL